MNNDSIKLTGVIKSGQTKVTVNNYPELNDKPSINGVELVGDKSLEDLGVNDLVDEKISKLVNAAPETLDTLGEIAEVLKDNEDVIETLNDAISKKANDSELSRVAKSGNYEDLTNKPSIPVKTSEILNDGDGQSKFATEKFVNENGGKIDEIIINGETQSIVDKKVSFSVPTDYLKDEDLNSIRTNVQNIQTDISKINEKDTNLQSQITNLDTTKASTNYVDTKVADLVNSAPETLDTLGELATAIQQNGDVVIALNQAIGNKVNSADISKVATTGMYDDLLKKPEIPSIEGLASEELVRQESQAILGIVENKADYNYVDTNIRESNKYDCIIRYQQEFDELCVLLDNGTCDYRSILFVGDGSELGFVRENLGLKLPSTLKLIDGINNATITISNFEYSLSNRAGIYTTLESPFNHEFTMNNITVNCSSSTGSQCYCFEGFYGMNNCTAIASSTYGGARVGGFKNCHVLNNCVVRVVEGARIYCFETCRYLINCFAESQTSSTTASSNYGFAMCYFMTNCATNIANGRSSIGYESCQDLTNCAATAIGTTTGYGFSRCTRVTNPSVYSGDNSTALYDDRTTYITVTKEDIANKLEKTNIIAGNNITLDVNGNDIIISSLGSDIQYPAGSGSDYDLTIRTQEEFEAFYTSLDNGTCTATSVLFVGTNAEDPMSEPTFIRSDGKGLKLPETLYKVQGINNVCILINNYVEDPLKNDGGIFYDNPVNQSLYSMTGITLIVNGTGKCTGFFNCSNLDTCNCGVGIDGAATDSQAFLGCTYLYNCIAVGMGINAKAFNYCSVIISCMGMAQTTGNGTGYGFANCNIIIGCTEEGSTNGKLLNCTNVMATLEDTGGSSETSTYDLTITNQEEFDAFCTSLDNGTCEAGSVLFVGTWGTTQFVKSDGKGLLLPPTLYKIKGINIPIIVITDNNGGLNNGGIKYNEIAEEMKDVYSIDGILLMIEGTSAASTGFNGCVNVKNCILQINGKLGCVGFYNCRNIKDTTLLLGVTNKETTGDKWLVGFMGCNDISGITAMADSEGINMLSNNFVFGSCSNIGFYNATGFGEIYSKLLPNTKIMATLDDIDDLITTAIEGSY